MKNFRTLLLSLTLLAPLYAGPIQSVDASATLRLEVNGQAVAYSQAPTLEEGLIMLPMRPIFEADGFQIEWVPETSSVKATKEGMNLLVTVGSKQATVNGTPTEMFDPVSKVNGSIMVPATFVAQVFNGQVVWDKITRTVSISHYEIPAHPQNPITITYEDGVQLPVYDISEVTPLPGVTLIEDKPLFDE